LSSSLLNSEFITHGGVVQYVLLVLSLLMSCAVLDQLLFSIVVRVRSLAGDRKNWLLDTLYYATVRRAVELAVQAQADDPVASRQLFHAFRRNVPFFSLVAMVSPILGIIGTVHGIILTFHEISNRPNVQFQDISQGMSCALYTTFFGLTLALVALAVGWLSETIAENSVRRVEVVCLTKRAPLA